MKTQQCLNKDSGIHVDAGPKALAELDHHHSSCSVSSSSSSCPPRQSPSPIAADHPIVVGSPPLLLNNSAAMGSLLLAAPQLSLPSQQHQHQSLAMSPPPQLVAANTQPPISLSADAIGHDHPSPLPEADDNGIGPLSLSLCQQSPVAAADDPAGQTAAFLLLQQLAAQAAALELHHQQQSQFNAVLLNLPTSPMALAPLPAPTFSPPSAASEDGEQQPMLLTEALKAIAAAIQQQQQELLGQQQQQHQQQHSPLEHHQQMFFGGNEIGAGKATMELVQQSLGAPPTLVPTSPTFILGNLQHFNGGLPSGSPPSSDVQMCSPLAVEMSRQRQPNGQRALSPPIGIGHNSSSNNRTTTIRSQRTPMKEIVTLDDPNELEEFMARGEEQCIQDMRSFITQFSLRQTTVAMMTGVSQPYISKLLNGNHRELSLRCRKNIYCWYLNCRRHPEKLAMFVQDPATRLETTADGELVPQRRERYVFRPVLLRILEAYFQDSPFPDTAKRVEIANACNAHLQLDKRGGRLMPKEVVTPQVVANWFANKRKEMRRRSQTSGSGHNGTQRQQQPDCLPCCPTPSPPNSATFGPPPSLPFGNIVPPVAPPFSAGTLEHQQQMGSAGMEQLLAANRRQALFLPALGGLLQPQQKGFMPVDLLPVASSGPSSLLPPLFGTNHHHLLAQQDQQQTPPQTQSPVMAAAMHQLLASLLGSHQQQQSIVPADNTGGAPLLMDLMVDH